MRRGRTSSPDIPLEVPGEHSQARPAVGGDVALDVPHVAADVGAVEGGVGRVVAGDVEAQAEAGREQQQGRRESS